MISHGSHRLLSVCHPETLQSIHYAYRQGSNNTPVSRSPTRKFWLGPATFSRSRSFWPAYISLNITVLIDQYDRHLLIFNNFSHFLFVLMLVYIKSESRLKIETFLYSDCFGSKTSGSSVADLLAFTKLINTAIGSRFVLWSCIRITFV